MWRNITKAFTALILFKLSGIDSHGRKKIESSFSLLSSRFLSKNLKIKIYKTIKLPVVLYGCEA